MDIDLLVILIIVISLIFGALWWGLLIIGIVKFAPVLRRQFEQQLKGLEALQQQWDQMNPQEQAAKRAQLGQAFLKLSGQLAQMNQITRQQYDNRVSGLVGLAGSAGIDWHP
jgi:biopolymer transport protein ExbB/TolQ